MLSIFLGLGLLIFLAYRGYSIIWVAPVCALAVALMGGLPLLPAYTETYMTGFVGFTKSWFPVFMLGAIFGTVMDLTGSAQSIASELVRLVGKKRAVLAIVVGCSVLTYGGISLFVVVFAMYPMALALFRETNISRKLIPGCIALGAFGYTMTATPGTPQIQNLIPMKYFNTTPMAAPILGIVATVVMAVGGYFYLIWKQKRLTSMGEVYIEPTGAAAAAPVEGNLPNPYLSMIPLLVVILTLNLLKWNIVSGIVPFNL